MGFLRNLMAMPGNLKPFINGQNRLILDFRFLLKNAYFSKTKCGHVTFYSILRVFLGSRSGGAPSTSSNL